MKTIDWLVSQGRDPLEILFAPLAEDVRQKLAEEESDKLDAELRYFLQYEMPSHLRARLMEWIERRCRAARAEKDEAKK